MVWAEQRHMGHHNQRVEDLSDTVSLITDLKEMQKWFFEVYKFKHNENAANKTWNLKVKVI